MKQPSRKIKKHIAEVNGTGIGIDTCNECPFLLLSVGKSICNSSDVILSDRDDVKIKVPEWCGNNKKYGKGIQGKK